MHIFAKSAIRKTTLATASKPHSHYTGNNHTNLDAFHIFKVEKTGETPEKEQIELKEGEEKKDDSTEKTKKKKEKKEKKPKEPKGPNCIDLISKDLNLGNRDANNVNVAIDVSSKHKKSVKKSFKKSF